MTNISITSSSDIRQASAELHDYWFDVDKILYDAEKRLLVIRFAEKQRDLNKFKYDSELTIKNVVSFKIEDTEKIGAYDLNRFSFDAKSKRLNLDCNIPLKFSIEVDW